MTVYQRIMRAAEQEQPLRLSFEEVFTLSMDNGIVESAERDDDSNSVKLTED